MKRCLLLCVLIVSLLASCQERKTKKQVDRLLAETVEIPSEIGQVLFGRDTLLMNVAVRHGL